MYADATTDQPRSQLYAVRLALQDAALRSARKQNPTWSYEMHARLLGIDLLELVTAAHAAALYEHQERAGQTSLFLLGVGVGQAMTEVL
jgi:hypothetical protein